MSPDQLLMAALLAMLYGLLGQGLRTVAGLHKGTADGAEEGWLDRLDWRLLAWTLLIGALAGLAAYLGLQYGSDAGADITSGPVVLGLVAAGYSGGDFIEAFVRRYLPLGSR